MSFGGKSYERLDGDGDSEKIKKKGFIDKIAGSRVFSLGKKGKKGQASGQQTDQHDDEQIVGLEGDIIPVEAEAAAAVKGVDDVLKKEEEYFARKKGEKKMRHVKGSLLNEKETDLVELEDEVISPELAEEFTALDDETVDDQALVQQLAQTKSKKTAEELIEDVKKKFAKLDGLRKSKGGETVESLLEDANDLSDIGATCAELAHKLAELSDTASKLAEAGSHASNAASAAPIVGAVLSFMMMAKACKQLSSVLKRQAAQKDIVKREPADEGVDAALRCIKDAQAQRRNVLGAEILWQATACGGHIASMTGVGALGGIPVAIFGAVASSATKVVETGLDYKEAQEHHKAVKASTEMGLDEDNAAKQLRHNPRKAVQVLINQANEAGVQGPVAKEYLASFGIKEKHLASFASEEDETKFEANKAMRKKVLGKLGAEDEDPSRIQEDIKGAGKAIKNYVPTPSKLKSIDDLAAAKNLLMGDKKRRDLWSSKALLLNRNPEKAKAQLLAAVNLSIEKGELKADAPEVQEAIRLLQPGPDQKGVKQI